MPRPIEDLEVLCTALIRPAHLKIQTYYQGTEKLAYRVWNQGKLLFEGRDFRPAPFLGLETREATLALLPFLCVQDGDVEDEYFKDWTPDQLAWRESEDRNQVEWYLEDKYPNL